MVSIETVIAIVVAFGGAVGFGWGLIVWVNGQIAAQASALNEFRIASAEKFATWEHVQRLEDQWRLDFKTINEKLDRLLSALARRGLPDDHD